MTKPRLSVRRRPRRRPAPPDG